MHKVLIEPDSFAACIDREEGAVSKFGTVSQVLIPALVDPLHVMLGVGCGEWGACLFLTISDAAKLSAELAQHLLADHSAKG